MWCWVFDLTHILFEIFTGYYKYELVWKFFFTCHIFPKAQVAADKNAHNFWHQFPAQFFMLFHMVWSILFGVLALKTIKWKFVEEFQPTRKWFP